LPATTFGGRAPGSPRQRRIEQSELLVDGRGRSLDLTDRLDESAAGSEGR